MANNKRIQIQHWYTTGNTAPSGTGLTNMLLGEIAIATQTGKEAIFIKNNDGSAVTFMTSAQTDSLITKKLGDAGIGGDDVISTLSQNLDEHIKTIAQNKNELNAKPGHVFLVSGDLNDNKETGNGLAAAANHTHGQYLTGVTVGSGLAIVGVIENGGVELQLDSETNNKINSGVTAYDWGNHATKGYAKNDDLTTLRNSVTAHTSTEDIHVTKTKKDEWDNASSAITAFLKDANLTGNAVDTLIEIQQFLDSTGSTVQTLLKTLDDLTETVSGNTTAITQNSENISLLATSASTNASKIENLGQTIGSGFTSDNTITSEINDLKSQQSNYVTSVIGSGNINVKPTEGVGRQFIVTHITAGTQTSEIKATNNPTGLSFGSEFKGSKFPNINGDYQIPIEYNFASCFENYIMSKDIININGF